MRNVLIRKFLISLISVLAFLCAMEVLARCVFGPGEFYPLRYMRFANDKDFGIADGKIKKGHFLVRDPVLFWRLNPKGHGFNKKGFRGDDFSIGKPPKTVRIICLGDSCTFGVEVEESEIFSRLLQDLLNKNSSGQNFEVINLGVPGYSSWQGLQLLRHEALALSPDIIIVYFGWNDVLPTLYYRDKQQIMPNPYLAFLQDLLSHSRLYRALEMISVRLQRFYLSRNDVCSRSESSARRVPPDDFKDNLEQMARIMKERGGKTIFMSLAFRDAGSLQQEIADEHNSYIQEAALKSGAKVVRLDEVFKTSGGGDLFWDDIHFNSSGHAVVADMIYRVLKRK